MKPTPPQTPQQQQECHLDELGYYFVKKCIEIIESRGLDDQGLYRIGGVNSRVARLLNMCLDRKNYNQETNQVTMPDFSDPVEWETKTITSALKNYLRNLSVPLMTYSLHPAVIAAAKIEDTETRKNRIKSLIQQLPNTNFTLLKLLVEHLRNVASHSEKNLMTVSNLGICFAPTLMRGPDDNAPSIMEIKYSNVVTNTLIEEFDSIFSDLRNKQTQKGDFHKNNTQISQHQSNQQMQQSQQQQPNNHQNQHHQQQPMEQTMIRSSQGNHQIQSTIPLPPQHQPQQPTSPQFRLTTTNANSSNNHDDHFGLGPLPTNLHLQQYYQNQHPVPAFNSLQYYPQMESAPFSSIQYYPVNSGINPYQYYPMDTNKLPFRSNKVVTLYACVADTESELSFGPNEIIIDVRNSAEVGWLVGTLERNGQRGLLPENYVMFI